LGFHGYKYWNYHDYQADGVPTSSKKTANIIISIFRNGALGSERIHPRVAAFRRAGEKRPGKTPSRGILESPIPP